MVDLIISGGTLVTSQDTLRAGVAVDAGVIVAIADDAALPEARERIDATGLHVLPGVIDTHTHLRDPSRNEREDWASGTMAAAAGGITTLFEMPISTPSVHSADVLRARAAAVRPKSYIDFGLYGGAAADNLDQIEGLAEAGAIAFKTFRTRVPAGREREFIGICAPEPGDYLAALERVADTGLLAAVHAEDAWLIDRLAARAKAAGDNGPLSHARSRPPVVEESAVAQCIAIARAAGARLHIVHCSSPYSVDLITAAREAGQQVSVETCPPYLFATEQALERHGPYAKTNPPVRSAEIVEALWDCVRTGEIDFVCTDHSPFLVEEKEPFWDDMWRATPGAPGLEAIVPLMLTAVNDGWITLEHMAALTSENAARLFGVWPRKGAIRIGSDADFTVVDLDRAGVIDTGAWHTHSKGTARMWHGLPITGAVTHTIVRGRLVATNNAIVGAPGWGEWVKP